MSKRHQASRRRAYGRRQHEVYERQSRRLLAEPDAADLATGLPGIVSPRLRAGSPVDPFAFVDAGGRRLRFAVGD